MSQWIATIARTEATKRKLRLFFKSQDIHRWVYGREKGKNGYQHYQVRFEWLDHDNPDAFKTFKDWFYSAHLEYARADNWDYEKKDGRYYTSNDTDEILRIRYGSITGTQREVLSWLDKTNDREILLWYDAQGRSGKSYLCNKLWETRRAYYCPPYLNGVKDLIQFVASGYNGEEYIVIDLPRAMKWDVSLYAGIEAIKDGLVTDARYSARTRNIRGAKVIVMSNSKPKLDRLSADRWLIYESRRPDGNTKDGSIPLGIEKD